MADHNLSINNNISPETYTELLRTKGRVQIPNFFSEESAEMLFRLIHANQNWFVTVNRGKDTCHMPLEKYHQLTFEERNQFFQENYQGATYGFQFFFLRYYLSQAVKENQDVGHPLHQYHHFANSPMFLEFMKTLSGVDSIREADTFAGLYEPGHFLTKHSDKYEDNDRVLAFVVNLTKDWRADWGGHLLFFDEVGNITEGIIPAFNTLNVFTIPQYHAVSMVNPFAARKRASFFGWMIT